MHNFLQVKKIAFIISFFKEPVKHCTSDHQIVGAISGSCRLTVYLNACTSYFQAVISALVVH